MSDTGETLVRASELAQAIRERDALAEALHEEQEKNAALRERLADAIKGLDYACETPLAGCDCPGCSLARDESGAPAPMEG